MVGYEPSWPEVVGEVLGGEGGESDEEEREETWDGVQEVQEKRTLGNHDSVGQ